MEAVMCFSLWNHAAFDQIHILDFALKSGWPVGFRMISPFSAAVAGHEVASRANVADAKSLLCGFYASDSGRSHFDGQEVTIGCTMLYI